MTQGSTEPEIACQLMALSPAEREQQKRLLALVRDKIEETRELASGFELRFASDTRTVLELAEWVTLESRCCRFAELSMAWRGDNVWVRLEAPPGGKDVLSAEMGLLDSPPRSSSRPEGQ